MLEINGKYYFTNVESILDKLKIQIHSLNNGNFMLCCPFHGERKPSFGIHKETGIYNCFACGERGDIISFVAKVLDTDKFHAIAFIEMLHSTERVSPTILDVPLKKQSNNYYEYNRYIDFKGYKYFHGRGISMRTVDRFDIGTEGDFIVFPIKNSQGDILAVQKRHMETKKFLFPKNFNIKNYVFGLAELNKYGDISKPVIVTESVIDCLTCWDRGQQAIAVYTAIPSQKQLSLLAFSKFNLYKDGFDRDKAGRIGWDLFKNVGIALGIRVLESKEHGKKDINDLSYKEFIEWVSQ